MKKLREAAIGLLLGACAFSGWSQAKYVFYFIGDGMGMGHVNAAEAYNRDVLKNGEPILMLRFPVASQVRTYSFNERVTDSAAAGTALSTGHKTRNGMIGMGPDTVPVTSIAADFMKAGYSVGIASTVAGDDATPASFYAHAPHRGMSSVIADCAIGSGVDFLAAPVFRGMKKADGKPSDWLDRMKKDGYTVINKYTDYALMSSIPGKMLMLAEKPQGEQVGFTIDSVPGTLTAEEITRTALSFLTGPGKSDKGFFLMVEGGNIDWGSHANDGATVIKEVLNYQKAIDVAYQFYLQHPDETLIVITADHDTGGMALGCRKNGHPRLDLIDWQKISKDRFSDYCKDLYRQGKSMTWEEMKQFLKENTGLWGAIPLTDEETARLRTSYENAIEKRNIADEKSLYNSFNRFSVDVYDMLNDKYGIGWITGYHTGNFVPLYAIGRDAMLFTPNLNNTDIPKLILKAAGIAR